MDVACSTLCFTSEPLDRALRHIADLEFGKVDLAIADGSPHLQPSDLIDDLNEVVQRIRKGPTIGIAALTLRLNASGEELLSQIDSAAQLGKQIAASILVIDAAPVGTPIEEEVERLSRLEKTVSIHGCVLTVVTKRGTITEDPDVALELCEKVPGLGVTLDPSHIQCGPHRDKEYDSLFGFVRHVQLRDSGTTPDEFQVKVGRGKIEYGKIVTSLSRHQYRGALSVAIEEDIPCDMVVESEVRKLRLLLESLL